MKVQFQQSGGFAGLLKNCEIDTETLPPDKAKEVHELVHKSELPRSGEFLSDTTYDLHQYDITIEDGATKKSVTYDDQSLPAAAKPLIGYLKKCAKPDSVG